MCDPYVLTRFSFDLNKLLGSLIRQVGRDSLNSIRIPLDTLAHKYITYTSKGVYHVHQNSLVERSTYFLARHSFWTESSVPVEILLSAAAKKSVRSKGRAELFTLYVCVRRTCKKFPRLIMSWITDIT